MTQAAATQIQISVNKADKGPLVRPGSFSKPLLQPRGDEPFHRSLLPMLQSTVTGN